MNPKNSKNAKASKKTGGGSHNHLIGSSSRLRVASNDMLPVKITLKSAASDLAGASLLMSHMRHRQCHKARQKNSQRAANRAVAM